MFHKAYYKQKHTLILGKEKLNKLVIMLVLASLIICSIPVLRVRANPTVWRVPFDFPNISAALDSGSVVPGDTIHVWNGIYQEHVMVYIPNIKIIGQSAAGAVLQGVGPGFCIAIFAPGVTLMELSIVTPAPGPIMSIGIYLGAGATGCKIWNNVVDGWDIGIMITQGASGNEIVGNEVSNCISHFGPPGPPGSCSVAIYMLNGATGNQVRGNEIGQTGPVWYGVGTWGASGNTITLNNFWNVYNMPAAFVGSGDINSWDSSTTGVLWGNWWTGTPPPYPIAVGDIDFFCHPAAYTWALYRWDVNRDGKVTIVDIAIIAKAWGTQWCMVNWNPKADLNKDGKVDIKDIALAAKNFGWTVP